MMAADFSRPGVSGAFVSREDILPVPFLGSAGIFAAQGVWERHSAIALFQGVIVSNFDLFEVADQRMADGLGQHGAAILVSLSAANRDLVTIEVQVLYPQG